MTSAAKQFFDTLKNYSDLEALIASGETENLYLECKSPSSPQLNKDLKATLAKAISGFSNTSGGILIWGISTTKHQHGSLDVLSQLEPIANCSNFMRQIARTSITATTPRVEGIESRALLSKPGETRGIILTFIPQTLGDPVRSNEDEHFYFRSGDEFTVAPYELIKRLFASTESPDLTIQFHKDLVNNQQDGSWRIPIIMENRSSTVAKNVYLSITIENSDACEDIKISSFRDSSSINPGKKYTSKN